MVVGVLAWKKKMEEMAFCIGHEYRLEGVSNYLQWKVGISVVLKEKKLWLFVSTVVQVPTLDPIALDPHKVKEARA